MSESNENKAITIFKGDPIEVGIVKSLLENYEIEAFLIDEIMGNLNPWLISPGGTGSIKVLVSNTDYEKAKQIVDEYVENNKIELPEENE
jgi:hypothetical protein